MKASNVQMMNHLQNQLQSKGILMSYQTDMLSGMTHVRLKRGEQAIFHTFSDYEDVEMHLKKMCDELYADNRGEVAELKMQLEKYKAAVKQLSFDLEMKSTTPRAVATEADVRKQTLEMAAEFLMDYGIIRSGNELESVCEQIRKLHPSKATTMANAASKMQEMFGSKP
jgi:hypothetical protein